MTVYGLMLTFVYNIDFCLENGLVLIWLWYCIIKKIEAKPKP